MRTLPPGPGHPVPAPTGTCIRTQPAAISAFPNYTTRGQNRPENGGLHGSLQRPLSTQWAWTTGNEAIAAASSMKRGLTCSPPSAEAPMSDPRYSRRCMGSRDTVQLVECLPGAQEALGSILHEPIWWWHCGGRGRQVENPSLSSVI